MSGNGGGVGGGGSSTGGGGGGGGSGEGGGSIIGNIMLKTKALRYRGDELVNNEGLAF